MTDWIADAEAGSAVRGKLNARPMGPTEQITSGASPTAASPDVDISYITTGGTNDDETITLALPSDPLTKLGRLKILSVVTLTSSNDGPKLDAANISSAFGVDISPSENDLYLPLVGFIELQLITSDGVEASWQLRSKVDNGVRTLYAASIKALRVTGYDDPALELRAGASDTQSGGVATLAGGDSNANAVGGSVNLLGGNSNGNGAGGTVAIAPGSGGTDGGNLQIDLPAAGSGNKGYMRVTGLDDYADDAAAAAGGVPVTGFYLTGSLVKRRAS